MKDRPVCVFNRLRRLESVRKADHLRARGQSIRFRCGRRAGGPQVAHGVEGSPAQQSTTQHPRFIDRLVEGVEQGGGQGGGRGGRALRGIIGQGGGGVVVVHAL